MVKVILSLNRKEQPIWMMSNSLIKNRTNELRMSEARLVSSYS